MCVRESIISFPPCDLKQKGGVTYVASYAEGGTLSGVAPKLAVYVKDRSCFSQ